MAWLCAIQGWFTFLLVLALVLFAPFYDLLMKQASDYLFHLSVHHFSLLDSLSPINNSLFLLLKCGSSPLPIKREFCVFLGIPLHP